MASLTSQECIKVCLANLHLSVVLYENLSNSDVTKSQAKDQIFLTADLKVDSRRKQKPESFFSCSRQTFSLLSDELGFQFSSDKMLLNKLLNCFFVKVSNLSEELK